MKKFLASCLIGGGLILGSVGGAFAAGDHTVPGTPGDANCKGQTTAYFAQAVKNFGGELPEEYRPGFGNLAKIAGLSNQEVKQIIDDYCSTP